MSYRIAAVVVTYNRLELLKQCIESLRNQIHKLDEIIIVNNSSTDGTLEWLNQQNDLTVITQENSGSAGGQYTGIKTAYEKGYDWVWCLDTDVIPNLDALEMLVRTPEFREHNTGFLTSTIYYTDGNLCYINMPYKKDEVPIVQSITKNNTIPVLSASFGSVLISIKAVAKIGFPIKDFFIWGDDVEYTFRIIDASFTGFLVATSKATHFAPNNFSNPFISMDYSDWKSFYCVRNTIYTIKLRNKLQFRSIVRTYLSISFFYFTTLVNYSKNNGWRPKALFKFSKYFLVGIKYNPRKGLLNQ